ncbi:MAG: M48 family metalloprotease [Patescibacteria group bacterium]
MPYEVYISDDSQANAYALPGAIIYVTQGLLEEIKYEEELIFII